MQQEDGLVTVDALEWHLYGMPKRPTQTRKDRTMETVPEKVKLAVEIGASMASHIKQTMAGCANLLQTCYEQNRLPTGIYRLVTKHGNIAIEQAKALAEMLEAATSEIKGD